MWPRRHIIRHFKKELLLAFDSLQTLDHLAARLLITLRFLLGLNRGLLSLISSCLFDLAELINRMVGLVELFLNLLESGKLKIRGLLLQPLHLLLVEFSIGTHLILVKLLH